MKIRNLATAAAIAVTAAAFVLGSAVSSEAKGKKKAEPAPQRSATCAFSAPAPVCATRGGMSHTYRNACWAGNDGAVVKAQKACPPAKAMKAGKKKMKAAKGAKKKK
jgi:hypothetical protein